MGRSSDRSADRGTDRGADRGADRDVGRSSDRGADRDSGRSSGRGADRDGNRGTDSLPGGSARGGGGEGGGSAERPDRYSQQRPDPADPSPGLPRYSQQPADPPQRYSQQRPDMDPDPGSRGVPGPADSVSRLSGTPTPTPASHGTPTPPPATARVTPAPTPPTNAPRLVPPEAEARWMAERGGRGAGAGAWWGVGPSTTNRPTTCQSTNRPTEPCQPQPSPDPTSH